MKCIRCNIDVPENAKFCPKCGAKIEIQNVQEPQIKGSLIESGEQVKSEVADVKRSKNIILCPRCKTENPSTAKFCRRDGTPLRGEDRPCMAVKEEIKSETKINKVKPKRRSKKPIWIGIGVIVFMVTGGYLYFHFSKQTGQIIKRLFEKNIPMPEVPQSAKPTKILEDMKKPTSDQEQKIRIKSPPISISKPPKLSVEEIAEIQKDLNRTFKNMGLGNVYVEIDEKMRAILKGIVNDPRDKMLALKILQNRKNIKEIRNEIVVVSIPPPSRIDPDKFEREINIALKNAGLKNIVAEVSDDLQVTLKGTVRSKDEKNKAFEIAAKSFKKAKKIKDKIFIIEQ